MRILLYFTQWGNIHVHVEWAVCMPVCQATLKIITAVYQVLTVIHRPKISVCYVTTRVQHPDIY